MKERNEGINKLLMKKFLRSERIPKNFPTNSTAQTKAVSAEHGREKRSENFKLLFFFVSLPSSVLCAFIVENTKPLYLLCCDYTIIYESIVIFILFACDIMIECISSTQGLGYKD